MKWFEIVLKVMWILGLLFLAAGFITCLVAIN